MEFEPGSIYWFHAVNSQAVLNSALAETHEHYSSKCKEEGDAPVVFGIETDLRLAPPRSPAASASDAAAAAPDPGCKYTDEDYVRVVGAHDPILSSLEVKPTTPEEALHAPLPLDSLIRQFCIESRVSLYSSPPSPDITPPQFILKLDVKEPEALPVLLEWMERRRGVAGSVRLPSDGEAASSFIAAVPSKFLWEDLVWPVPGYNASLNWNTNSSTHSSTVSLAIPPSSVWLNMDVAPFFEDDLPSSSEADPSLLKLMAKRRATVLPHFKHAASKLRLGLSLGWILMPLRLLRHQVHTSVTASQEDKNNKEAVLNPEEVKTMVAKASAPGIIYSREDVDEMLSFLHNIFTAAATVAIFKDDERKNNDALSSSASLSQSTQTVPCAFPPLITFAIRYSCVVVPNDEERTKEATEAMKMLLEGTVKILKKAHALGEEEKKPSHDSLEGDDGGDVNGGEAAYANGDEIKTGQHVVPAAAHPSFPTMPQVSITFWRARHEVVDDAVKQSLLQWGEENGIPCMVDDK